MRMIAPILIGLCLVTPIAIAESPSALDLPATLHLSDTNLIELEDIAAQLDDLPSAPEAVPSEPEAVPPAPEAVPPAPEAVPSEPEAEGLQLKDFIRGLGAVEDETGESLSLIREPVPQNPFIDEILEAIALQTSESKQQPANLHEVQPTAYDETIGDKIRSRSDVDYNGIELGNGGGPSDSLDDENAFDKGYFNDIDEAEARTRTARSHLSKLRKPVTAIRIKAGSPSDEIPPNQAQQHVGQEASTWITASGAALPKPDRYTIGFSHRPLYYEELDLERCGLQHGCLQYEVSGFYFLFNTFVLPYRMATQCPGRLVCTPGDCASCQYFPCEIEPLQCNRRGLIAETAAIAGFTFLLL